MNFSKKAISLAGILLIVVQSLPAQVRQTREEYIDRYKSIAVAHMERYGIPASITMAQGILESDCGNSWLSLQSNNHFGIKCKRNWTGDKVYYDDDAKGECFRSYPLGRGVVQGSCRISRFAAALRLAVRLLVRRLQELGAGTQSRRLRHGTRLRATAHAHHRGEPALPARPARRRAALRLAHGTQGNRPRRVVRRPEQRRTGRRSFAGHRPGQLPRDDQRAHNGNVYQTNGVHYVLAKEGDTFENIGQKFRISARNLRKFNDLKDKKAQPLTGEVGLHRKRKKKRWEGNAHTHICRQGETPAGAVGAVVRHPHPFDRKTQPPQARRARSKRGNRYA